MAQYCVIDIFIALNPIAFLYLTVQIMHQTQPLHTSRLTSSFYLHYIIHCVPPYGLCKASITIKLASVTANAIKATNIIVPRLAGNFPRITQYWPCRYRLYPSNKIKILIAKNMAPSGFPKCRSDSARLESPSSDVFNRKSCVIAMPMDAKAREVRSQARNVRSTAGG